jgi:uncharacterized lipoprotein
MRSTFARPSMSRAAVAGLLLIGLAVTSGCGWFRKSNELYAQSPESRPLEVPPDLDMPRTEGGMAVPPGGASSQAAAPTPAPEAADATGGSAAGGATAAASPAAGTGVGFTTAGSRDEVYARVDGALAGIAGLEVANRAALLGVFDVSYQGSNFLVRVSATEAGAYVSAVDPRGLPATGEAPTQLIAALKTALGGN